MRSASRQRVLSRPTSALAVRPNLSNMLETVEGDALTVKVTGDGKDFGTYRRKAWQIVGTTLYEELIEEGKFFKGVNAVSSRSLKSDLVASSLSRIGDLVPLETTKISLALKQFMILGEPPVEAGELALRSGNEFAFDHYLSHHRFDIVLTVLEQRNKATKIFGRQDVVRVKERHGGKFSPKSFGSGDATTWHSTLESDFAPALGFPLHQIFQHEGIADVTCELASLRGPGARYVAMDPVAGGNRQETATQDSESETTATQSLVKQAVAVDTTPPALQVIEAVTASGPVVSIEGQVHDQSPIAELSVQGVPVPLGADGKFTIRRGVPVGESEIIVAPVDVWGNVVERRVRVRRTLFQTVPKATTQISSAANPANTSPPVIETVTGLSTNLEVETISGRVTGVSKIASLTIEGEPVTIGANGAFSLERKLPIGESRLRIAAVDAQGNRAETIVSVLRKPHIPKVNYGNYHALVIGNADYQDLPKLQTAVVDAEAVAKILDEEYGFRVKLLTDVTREDMIDAFDILREELGENDNLLVYHAGHGWLDEASSRGYWQPVNAQINRRLQWMSNATLTDSLKALKAKHVMLVADSCYSGVLTRSIKVPDRTIDYIERMASRRARVVLTSGGLEPVMDSGGGKHSVFAEQFLKVLKNNTGVLDRTQLFEQVRRPVVLAAPQTPQYSDIRFSGHDGGDFLFVRKY